MNALSTSDLLNVWESGLDQPPAKRALSLLVVANPNVSPGELAKLSIGQRDFGLLMLRELVFGSNIECIATCPTCKEQLEFAFRTDDIRTKSEINSTEPLTLEMDGYEIQFRLPNSLDLIAVSDFNDVLSARDFLLKCCLLRVAKDGKSEHLENPRHEVIEAISARMSEIDPQADMQLSLICPTCRHAWQAAFDIVSFLWREIDAWAQRTLLEVVYLASSYGWRESDILNMSPWRRQFYLGALGG
jgi:hypothetical protein